MRLTNEIVSVLAESPVLWLLPLAIILIGYLKSAHFKGFWGELRVRFATDFQLDRQEYRPLHNITLKTPDGTTQIDHIIVSPYGIFVIETKNLKGWIFGDSRSKQWTQALFRNKCKFQNPLHQNYKHVKAVQNHLSLNPQRIHSVVVFVGRSRFKTLVPQNVVDTKGFLPYVRSKTETVFDENQIAEIIKGLKTQRLAKGSRRRHIQNLKANSEKPVCPRCGKAMTLRTASKGSSAGEQFWGCTGFPKI